MPKFGFKQTEEHKKNSMKNIRKAHKGTKKPWAGQYKIKPLVKKNCLVCKKQFEVIKSRENNAKFCSNKCRGLSLIGKSPSNKGIHKASSYGAYHYKVRIIRGSPKKCQDCGTTKAKKFEWANLTGHYENEWDYKRLCTRCHCKLDKKNNLLGKNIKIIK
jgi:hypothetical protein